MKLLYIVNAKVEVLSRKFHGPTVCSGVNCSSRTAIRPSPHILKAFIVFTLCVCAISIAVSQGVIGHGTTILLVRNPSEIIIGADSKMSYVNPLNDSLMDTFTECKIRVAGNIAFAFGTFSYSPNGFDVPRLATEAACMNGGLNDVVHSFDPVAFPQYEREFNLAESTYNEHFIHHFVLNERVELFFVGVKKDSRSLVYLTYHVEKNDTGKLVAKRFIVPYPPFSTQRGAFDAIKIGFYMEIDSILDSNEHFFDKLGFVDGVQQLVEFERGRHPIEVGGYIDILKIDSTGTQWQRRKSGCKARETCPE